MESNSNNMPYSDELLKTLSAQTPVTQKVFWKSSALDEDDIDLDRIKALPSDDEEDDGKASPLKKPPAIPKKLDSRTANDDTGKTVVRVTSATRRQGLSSARQRSGSAKRIVISDTPTSGKPPRMSPAKQGLEATSK